MSNLSREKIIEFLEQASQDAFKEMRNRKPYSPAPDFWQGRKEGFDTVLTFLKVGKFDE